MEKTRPGFKTAVQIGAAEVVKGAFLFGAAGTFRWWQAWVSVASGVLFGALATLFFQGSPELLEERKTAAKKAKAWDKRIMPLVMVVLPTLLLVLAGLDRRWAWTRCISPALSILALLLMTAGTLLFFWAQKVNAFFSSFARIQADRGHQVVDAGPYRFVRHPGYSGLILAGLSLPVLLASLPALAAGAAIAALYVLRTALEDRMLRDELDGYAAYADRVRHRLIPGLW